MDKPEIIGRLLLDALSKARELPSIALEPELRLRASEIMKAAKDASRKVEELTEVHRHNGKLDKATLERGLDRVLTAMEKVNSELDDLLAKARG